MHMQQEDEPNAVRRGQAFVTLQMNRLSFGWQGELQREAVHLRAGELDNKGKRVLPCPPHSSF